MNVKRLPCVNGADAVGGWGVVSTVGFCFLQSLRLASQAASLYTWEALSTFRKVIFMNFTEYIYKSPKKWYNNCAKQTKYTVFGCILFFRDTYTLFWLYSFVLNLIKCKFRTRESIAIPNLYIVCLTTTGICVFVRWLRSAHFLFYIYLLEEKKMKKIALTFLLLLTVISLVACSSGNTIKCSKCGNENSDTVKFCSNCGR